MQQKYQTNNNHKQQTNTRVQTKLQPTNPNKQNVTKNKTETTNTKQ